MVAGPLHAVDSDQMAAATLPLAVVRAGVRDGASWRVGWAGGAGALVAALALAFLLWQPALSPAPDQGTTSRASASRLDAERAARAMAAALQLAATQLAHQWQDWRLGPARTEPTALPAGLPAGPTISAEEPVREPQPAVESRGASAPVAPEQLSDFFPSSDAEETWAP